MFDLSTADYFILGLCGLLIGMTKTGLPGLGILVVPLMASILPAKASVGVVLPMLIFADIFAVSYYRRHAVWRHLLPLIPWTSTGLLTGYWAMGLVSDAQLRPIIGIIVLIMLGVNFWRTRKLKDEDAIPSHWAFAASLGFFAGLTTMMANAAGPIMIIYLLAMRLPKTEFIGTGAWYFMIVNWVKVPFFLDREIISGATLRLDLFAFPAIAIGAFIGIFFLKRVPEKAFSIAVQMLAVVAALNLVFSFL
jgi:hypothetical protein